MRILIAHQTKIPVITYGGTERIMWWLGKELVRLGHQVTYLVNRVSTCPFAKILEYNHTKTLNDQIPEEINLVHLFFQPREEINKPYLVTNQGNVPNQDKFKPLDQNTIFVSKNHARRHKSECFVYNGIDTEEYGNSQLDVNRDYFHFLAKANWRAKNLNGAIKIARNAGKQIHVIGGSRINTKRRATHLFDNQIKFHGMVAGQLKNDILNHSKGLIFPVLWNEPFGIAMIESLYLGCPVFGTTHGSLPEIVNREVGFLSNSESELTTAILELEYSPETCQTYVMKNFTSELMTRRYLELYEQVLSGQKLNDKPPSAMSTFKEIMPATLLP